MTYLKHISALSLVLNCIKIVVESTRSKKGTGRTLSFLFKPFSFRYNVHYREMVRILKFAKRPWLDYVNTKPPSTPNNHGHQNLLFLVLYHGRSSSFSVFCPKAKQLLVKLWTLIQNKHWDLIFFPIVQSQSNRLITSENMSPCHVLSSDIF